MDPDNKIAGAARINEVVGWLTIHAPADLESLRSEFGADRDPDVKRLLQPGVTALAPDNDTQRTSDRFVWLRAEASLRFLKKSIVEGNNLLTNQRARLLVARRWQLAAALVAPIGSATVWGVLRQMSNQSKIPDLMAGLVTLAASVLAVMALKSAEEPVTGGSLVDRFRQRFEARIRAEQIAAILQIRIRERAIGASEEPLIEEANMLASKLLAL